MNLILWRHAEAEPMPDLPAMGRNADLQRSLTRRGEKQAELGAAWLRNKLPPDVRLLCSPAQRCRQTAGAFAERVQVSDALAPDTSVEAVLAAAGWPNAGGTVVVVGHQPWLGAVASRLLAGQPQAWSVAKGAIWWLAGRDPEDGAPVRLRAVIDPDWL